MKIKYVCRGLISPYAKFCTDAKLCFANTCENMTKKQLYQVKYEKVELSPELEKNGYE